MAAPLPRVLVAEGAERTMRFHELAEQVQVKDGRLVVRVLRAEDLASSFLRVTKDGTKKASKRAVPEKLLHTYCTVSLGDERVTSLTVHASSHPQWVCSIDTELSLQEAEDMRLAVNVCHADSTEAEFQTAAEEGLELPDRIGFLDLRVIDVLREMVDDDYRSVAYALSSDYFSNPGSVVLRFNYKEDYKDFLEVLAAEDFLLLKLFARLRISINAEFPLCLVSVLMHRGDITSAASALVVDHVVRNTDVTGNDMFRDESLASSVVEDFMKIAARSYIDRVVAPLIAEMITRNLNCEIYPAMIKPPDTATSALANLRTYLDWFLPLLFSSAPLFPTAVCQILAAMANAAAAARPKTPHIRQITVSSFVFLRLLNPVLLAPHQYGVIPSVDFQGNLPRALVYMAKTLQVMASFSEFGAKEDFMAPLNSVVARYTKDMVRFLDALSNDSLLPGSVKVPVSSSDLRTASSEGPSPSNEPHAESSEFQSELHAASMSTSTELPFGNDAGSQASDETSPQLRARSTSSEAKKTPRKSSRRSPRGSPRKSPRIPTLPITPRTVEDCISNVSNLARSNTSGKEEENEKGKENERRKETNGENGRKQPRKRASDDGDEMMEADAVQKSPKSEKEDKDENDEKGTPRSARGERKASRTDEKRSKLKRTKSKEYRKSLQGLERPRSSSASVPIKREVEAKVVDDSLRGPMRPRQKSRDDVYEEDTQHQQVRSQPLQNSPRHSRVTISPSGGGGHLRRASSTTPRSVRFQRADSIESGISESERESFASAATSADVTPRSEVSADDEKLDRLEKGDKGEKTEKRKGTVDGLKPKKKNMFKQRFSRRTLVVTASEQEALQRDKAAWIGRMAASDKAVLESDFVAPPNELTKSDPLIRSTISSSALPAIQAARLPSLQESPESSSKDIKFSLPLKEVNAKESNFPGRAVARVYRQVAHDYRTLMNALLDLDQARLRERLESVMGRMAVKEAKSREERAREMDRKAPLSARGTTSELRVDKRRSAYKKNRAKSVGEVKAPSLRVEPSTPTPTTPENNAERPKKKSGSMRRALSRSRMSADLERRSDGSESSENEKSLAPPTFNSHSSVPAGFATPREHGERRGLVGRLRALSSSRTLKTDKSESEGKRGKKEKKKNSEAQNSEAAS